MRSVRSLGDDHRARVGGTDPQAQTVGSLLARAAAPDQQAPGVLHLVVVEAGLAGQQMLTNLVGLRGAQLGVVEFGQVRQHRPAIAQILSLIHI